MLFFSQSIANFNQEFSQILLPNIEEESNEGEQGENESSNTIHQQSGRMFQWLKIMQLVSDCVHSSWDECFQMNIYSFFNIYTFILQDNQNKTKLQQQWKSTRI